MRRMSQFQLPPVRLGYWYPSTGRCPRVARSLSFGGTVSSMRSSLSGPGFLQTGKTVSQIKSFFKKAVFSGHSRGGLDEPFSLADFCPGYQLKTSSGTTVGEVSRSQRTGEAGHAGVNTPREGQLTFLPYYSSWAICARNILRGPPWVLVAQFFGGCISRSFSSLPSCFILSNIRYHPQST